MKNPKKQQQKFPRALHKAQHGDKVKGGRAGPTAMTAEQFSLLDSIYDSLLVLKTSVGPRHRAKCNAILAILAYLRDGTSTQIRRQDRHPVDQRVEEEELARLASDKDDDDSRGRLTDAQIEAHAALFEEEEE